MSTIRLQHGEYEIPSKPEFTGGQAAIYKVRRVADGEVFALKIASTIDHEAGTPLDAESISENAQRIEQEISFLQRLQQNEEHHIVPCLDVGKIALDGKQAMPGFVMPFYVNTLRKTLLGNVSLSRKLKWIRQMGLALRHIHQYTGENKEALVHRDFNMENMALTTQDELRLLDFGVSKSILQDTKSSYTGLWRTRRIAPEQLLKAAPITEAKDSGLTYAIGTHTDMYTMGLVIHELIHGSEAQPAVQQRLEKRGFGKLEIEHSKRMNDDKKAGNPIKGLFGNGCAMTNEETEALYQAFLTQMESELGNTCLHKNAQKAERVARDFSVFVQKLLDWDYTKRPSAADTVYWIGDITVAFQNIQTTCNTEKGKPWLKWFAWSGGAITTVAVGWFIWQTLSTPSPLAELESCIYSNTSKTTTTDCWSKLHDLSKSDPDAGRILNNYEKQADTWIQGSDSKQWAAAVTALERAAKRNDLNALLWLAYAHHEGRGVSPDWGQAWEYYSSAIRRGASSEVTTKRTQLERQANAILQNRASSLEERSKAYQVIKKVAENTSSGNNAHLWMAYRYKEGDGVTKDTILEQYWQDRHDGKATSTTPKGSSE